MAGLTYRFDPAPGYIEYKVTSMLKDYLGILMELPENQQTIDQIIKLINGYTLQLRTLRIKNRLQTVKEIYKAIDGFFEAAAEENKKEIQCTTGCTACCFIDVDVCTDEARVIIDYCKENEIEIDREYLINQAAVGRKSYTTLSRCVFLKESLCSIYPVRPIACRKHWVKSAPVFCDFSQNIINQVDGYFDINTEILASAVLNVGETGPIEKVLISELEKTENQ